MNYALVFNDRKRNFEYGYCPQCKKANHSLAWCNPCDRKALVDKFNTWSTGNKDLDLFIQETQRTATDDLSKKCVYLEYVPYDRFTDVKSSLGGFGDFAAGEVFTAIWLDGERKVNWGKYNKARSSPLEVSLEMVVSSTNIDHTFIDEVIIGVCLPFVFYFPVALIKIILFS